MKLNQLHVTGLLTITLLFTTEVEGGKHFSAGKFTRQITGKRSFPSIKPQATTPRTVPFKPQVQPQMKLNHRSPSRILPLHQMTPPRPKGKVQWKSSPAKTIPSTLPKGNSQRKPSFTRPMNLPSSGKSTLFKTPAPKSILPKSKTPIQFNKSGNTPLRTLLKKPVPLPLGKSKLNGMRKPLNNNVLKMLGNPPNQKKGFGGVGNVNFNPNLESNGKGNGIGVENKGDGNNNKPNKLPLNIQELQGKGLLNGQLNGPVSPIGINIPIPGTKPKFKPIPGRLGGILGNNPGNNNPGNNNPGNNNPGNNNPGNNNPGNNNPGNNNPGNNNPGNNNPGNNNPGNNNPGNNNPGNNNPGNNNPGNNNDDDHHHDGPHVDIIIDHHGHHHHCPGWWGNVFPGCATPIAVPGVIIQENIVEVPVAPLGEVVVEPQPIVEEEIAVDVEKLPEAINGDELTLLVEKAGQAAGKVVLEVAERPMLMKITDWQESYVTAQLPKLLMTEPMAARIYIATAKGELIEVVDFIIMPEKLEQE